MNRALGVTLLVGAIIVVACLPGDTRPEPGRVYVSVGGSDATVNGFVTNDGWTIRFEKVLVKMGYTVLAGPDCDVYGESRYLRLFDVVFPDRQKLGLVYGLKDCEVQFFVWSRDPDHLAKGVNNADVDMMRGIWRPPPQSSTSQAAIFVVGNATDGFVNKHFEWRFGMLAGFTECKNPVDGTINTSLHLRGGEDLHPIVTVHGEELFRDSLEPNARLRFGQLAAADTNADGQLTAQELNLVPGPNGEMMDWMGFIQYKLVPHMFYLDGNRCQEDKNLSELWEYDKDFEFSDLLDAGYF